MAAFSDNLYSWALGQWDHHVRTDFEEIHSLRSSLAVAAAEALALFDVEQRKALGRVLTERFRAAEQRRSPMMDAAAMDLLARFDVERGTRVQPLAVAAALSKKPPFSKLLRTHLKRSLPPVIGGLSVSEPGVWRAKKELGEWTATTVIFFGGRARQLGYEHIIQPSSGTVRVVRTSLLTWLGLSGSTIWDMIATEEEAERTSLAFKKACETFFGALPELLPK